MINTTNFELPKFKVTNNVGSSQTDFNIQKGSFMDTCGWSNPPNSEFCRWQTRFQFPRVFTSSGLDCILEYQESNS